MHLGSGRDLAVLMILAANHLDPSEQARSQKYRPFTSFAVQFQKVHGSITAQYAVQADARHEFLALVRGTVFRPQQDRPAPSIDITFSRWVAAMQEHAGMPVRSPDRFVKQPDAASELLQIVL